MVRPNDQRRTRITEVEPAGFILEPRGTGSALSQGDPGPLRSHMSLIGGGYYKPTSA